jgi:hypothetical protein
MKKDGFAETLYIIKLLILITSRFGLWEGVRIHPVKNVIVFQWMFVD